MPFWDRTHCPYESIRLCASSIYSDGVYKCIAQRCPILDKHTNMLYNNNINKNESENSNETF